MTALSRLPALFVGHGSPMNAVEDNEWSRGFRALAELLPTPKAILSVSAHWYVGKTALTAQEHPRTIHDFYGFPDELYRVRYPAPGSPALAERAAELLGLGPAALTGDWGLDHGTWSVLRAVFPEANVPVVQLSLNAGLSPGKHLELAALLKPLREEGVLVFGSGNVVHNLPYVFRYFGGMTDTPDWAANFDQFVAEAVEKGDLPALAGALATPDGALAHPTPDHYLPLLYVAGAAQPGEEVRFPLAGFSLGSLSMRAVLVG